jgi:Tol biopolymer transport system component/DNA-binding winged helix-turn-helix (wHTH) protein
MSADKDVSPAKLCFGVFEVDLRAGELRKSGVRMKLQGQPFKMLAILLERPGELVTREELRERIWGSDTVVDFDHGIGVAVNKVREALGDAADRPRYVETLAKRGFRFISPVSPTAVAVPLRPPTDEPATSPSVPMFPRRQGAATRVAQWAIPVLILASLSLASLSLRIAYRSSLATPVDFSRVTWSNHVYPGNLGMERFAGVSVSGGRVYFSEVRNGRFLLASTSVSGGDSAPVATPAEIVRPIVSDVSRDGSKLLVRSLIWSELEQPMWIVASTGESARKVAGVLGHDASWLPDGRSLVYAAGHDLLISSDDGQPPRKLATVPGRAFWIRYSPDGDRLRFTVVDPSTRAMSLWELSSDGKNLSPLLRDWPDRHSACCGSWAQNGDSFVFQTTTTQSSDLWMLNQRRGLFSRPLTPVQITAGPLSYFSPALAETESQIFAIGAHDRYELSVVDPVSRTVSPFLPNLNALKVSFTRDGQWVAWISADDGTLWRSRLDGSERLQLVGSPFFVFGFRWDPEGRRIAFSGRQSNSRARIYVVSADGGSPIALFDEERTQADPSWAPDGKSVAFGRAPDYQGEAGVPKAIEILDLKSKERRTLPGSAGLFSPRWSPSGSSLAALSLDQSKLLLFDFASQTWTVLATGNVASPEWSSDEAYIYFRSKVEGDPFYRVSLADRRVEAIMDFKDRPADEATFGGLSPRNQPIVVRHSATANLYSIKMPR